MAKSIVYCADGTWQAPLNNTNVYRFFKGLTTSSQQVAFYDDGIGADGSGIERLIQGATGGGLLDKVKHGYTKIAHSFEAGDSVYLLGFSRGAYTARSLAGMIAGCGLPAGTFDDALVDSVFSGYRDRANRAAHLAPLAGKLTCGAVTFVGVWDTVGSLGIPAIFGGFDEKAYGFLDTKLHPEVKFAYQCLAVDERRRQFPATLWEANAGVEQTLEQVYFSGCHCDVGGGTTVGGTMDAGTRLCDITLGYMVARAQAAGLEFEQEFLDQCVQLAPEFALDAIRESWAPAFGLPMMRPIAATASVGNSVEVRIQYALTYLPANLKIAGGTLADSYARVRVVDEAP